MSMKVLEARAALLSNYEVLKLLREREEEQNVFAKAATVKEEPDEAPRSAPTSLPLTTIAGQNTRTVQFEAIGYLGTAPIPTNRQDDAMVIKLLRALQRYELTKLEKLQFVNLLPTSIVELYVIVEDLEFRFSEADMSAMVQAVKKCMKKLTDDEVQEIGTTQVQSMMVDGLEMSDEEEKAAIVDDEDEGNDLVNDLGFASDGDDEE